MNPSRSNPAAGHLSVTSQSRRAEAIGARLPPLLVAAERVAATVAQGVHGRRRTGQGDSFWEYRSYAEGDPLTRVDWWQSARSGRPAPEGWVVRETEWEAAQTVCLWHDASLSMRWRSRGAEVEKRDRAALLLLALASLLLRGGERVMVMRPDARPISGRFGLDRLAEDLLLSRDEDSGLPPHMAVPRHATVVLFGDFLSPLEEIQSVISRLAGVPVTGYLLQILDPAETLLPYAGRVRFRGLERDGETLIPRVESIRDEYARRLKAQQEGLAALCTAAGFGFGIHRTDHPPEAALLSLYTALGDR